MRLMQNWAMRNDGLYLPRCLGEWRKVQFSVWCYTQWHNLHPRSRHITLASVFAPLFLLFFPIESLHLNLILRREHFPQDCLFKGALFPEGFLREHWSLKRKGKLRFQKPKRALREVISLLFYKCSTQFLFWLQFYLGVPMAAETTQTSFLWFSASQELFERNHCP